MADKFFDRYPRGFCLFFLVGEHKSYLFGPNFEHRIFELSDSLINELRQNLRHQLSYLQDKNNPKHIYIFYCQRTGYSEEKALAKTIALKQFFNEKVFKAYVCKDYPVHLKEVPYQGYVGGFGIDKKKMFTAFIKYRQKKIEKEPRKLVTLEIQSCEPKVIFSDGTFAEMSSTFYGTREMAKEAQGECKSVIPMIQKPPPAAPFNTFAVMIASIVIAVAVYVPLLVVSITKK